MIMSTEEMHWYLSDKYSRTNKVNASQFRRIQTAIFYYKESHRDGEIKYIYLNTMLQYIYWYLYHMGTPWGNCDFCLLFWLHYLYQVLH